jgi:6-phosphogluconolactonase
MQCPLSLSIRVRVLCLAVLLLICATQANATDSYNPADKVLTIPTLAIGSATYSNVILTVNAIVTLPSGNSANGPVDRYDPVSGHLTVQSVSFNNRTYYNVVVTVTSLGSVGGVGGADSYNGTDLTVSSVQVASTNYVDVLLAVSAANIRSVAGGMPLSADDVYTPATGMLTIPAVQAYGHVYTNVTLSVALSNVVSVGGTGGRFVYVSNTVSNTISVYSINRQTGALTPLATIPVTGSASIWEIHIDPSGRYLYVLDYGAAGIYGYSINQADGSLSALNSGAAFASGNAPISLAFDASGAYAYAASNFDSTIWAYSLNPQSGALTPLSSSPYQESGFVPQPQQIARAGNYIYVANGYQFELDVFAITPGTGALKEGAPGSPYTLDTQPYSVTTDPSGSVVYAANVGTGDGSIDAFTTNLSTGAASPVAGNPLAVPAFNELTTDSQGKFLFVPETSAVAVYPFNTASGVLGALVGTPFVAGTNPYIAVTDPTDRFVYVANDGSASVSEYTFASGTGAVAPVAGSPVAAGSHPDFIAIR